MLRFALLFISVSLFACKSDQKNNSYSPEILEDKVSEEIVNEFEPHAFLTVQKQSVKSIDDCSLVEPLYLADRIEDLNSLSQQMFALDNIYGINGYANFITLAQLALTGNTHTSDLIEQLGLSGITENNEWFNVFCYLEAITPTNKLSATIADDWLIRDDLYTSLIQKFEANFTSRSIDPEKDLWRLSLDNSWKIELQLTTDNETPKYVNYQNAADTQKEVAHAIKIIDNIQSVSGGLGDYFSITNDSDYIFHIIMPTFAQYPHVKSNIVGVLNEFKALEKIPQNELHIPYFSETKTKDSFISISAWLTENSAQTLFDDENQDYSGINQYEMFKQINSYNSNNFEFNAKGKIAADYSNGIDVEALVYVEQVFDNGFYDSNFTALDGNFIIIRCSEKVESEHDWRPYFMIIENANNGLIYSIVTNELPDIISSVSFCIE